MGKKCCVPKCKSGYDSVTFEPSIKISFHAFPPDSDLRSEWKLNISRPNWEPSPSSSVCSLHFHENDFQNSSTDGNKQRKDSRPTGEQLKYRRLLSDAVPTIFTNLPTPIRKRLATKKANDDSALDDNDQEMQADEIGTNKNLSIEEEKPLSVYKSKTNSGKTKKFKVKVEDTFSNNPWCVDDATAFLKFCCPECDYHIPDLEMFSDHAVENHIKSSALFGEETKNEEGVLLVKQEELEYENNDDYLEQNDAMQTDDYVSYSHYEENDYPSQALDQDDEDDKKDIVSIKEEENSSSVKELRVKDSLETPITCTFCDLACYSVSDILQHHSDQHESETPQYFQCNLCEICHQKKTYVESHSMKIHGKHFMCRKCGKILDKTETYEDHLAKSKLCKKTLKKSGGLDKTTCDVCNFQCTSIEELKNHKLEHQDGKFKLCFYCDFKIEDWIRLRFHIDRKHPEHGEKKYSCDICGKCFIFEQSCREHKRKRHPKNTQEHVCHICGFSTKSKLHINRHILAKHENDKHKKCPHCDYHTAYINGIHVHIDGNHSELYKKQFDCDHCSKSFIFEDSLKKHLSKAQTRKQLSCKLCGLQMLKILELEKHVQDMHPKNENGEFKENPPSLNLEDLAMGKIYKEKAVCDLCNLECACSETLKRHRLKEHQDDKKFKCCMYCDYKNPTWDNLKHHIDGHHPEHGEKKHLCDLCGKGFIFQASCKRHKLFNHQKKHCHICGKECFNKESLKDHLSAVHKYDMMTLVCKFCAFSTNSKGCLKTHIIAKHKLENHKKCPYCDYHSHAMHRIHIHIDSKHPEHDKKHFSCDHCSRRFIYEASLKTHLDNIRNGPKNGARKKMKADRQKFMAAAEFRH